MGLAYMLANLSSICARPNLALGSLVNRSEHIQLFTARVFLEKVGLAYMLANLSNIWARPILALGSLANRSEHIQ